MQLKVKTGILSRKDSTNLIRTDFVPLHPGHYELGQRLGPVIEVLLPGKPKVYLPIEKLNDQLQRGEVEIFD
jgi:hypothetical protein